MMALGALAVLSPYVLLVLLIVIHDYIPAPTTGGGGIMGIFAIGFFAWMFLSIIICQKINKKYTHYTFLQDPNKERNYRWQYLIIFEDEVNEWKNYIKKNPLMRPSGTLKPVVVSRQTYQVLREMDAAQFKS
jgi:hypothetical protein